MKARLRAGLVMLLTLTMILGCSITASADNAGTESPGQTILDGQVTDNVSDNYYSVWSSVINSYLTEASDGSLVRVEYTGSDVLVETYTAGGALSDSRNLECELPLFGGFYAGEDAYYLVFGKTNPEDSDSAEVMRVVKYSQDWERLNETNIYGANTYIPFDAGSLRMTETGGLLYIHTCHEMYTSSDGLNHQANMTFVIDEESMTVSDSIYSTANIGVGYVSHSFNQFIQTDGTWVYRVDHGDAYPRAVTIIRSAVNGSIWSVTYAEAVSISGAIGANATGVSVGGFELSESNCLIAGNSVDLSDEDTYNTSGQRNIFLTVTDKDLNSTETIWLTDYTEEDGITPRTPQLVKLNDNSFLIMWEEYDSATGEVRTDMVTVDGNGNLTSNRIEVEMRLSDCQPIVTSNGLVAWYVSDGSSTILYTIDPDADSLDAINIRDFGNGPHEAGEPVIENEVPATCTEEGSYESVVYCSSCGIEMGRESVSIPAAGHSYEGSITQEPSCTEEGTMTYTCSICGDSYTEPVPATGHTGGEPVIENEVPATCTEEGSYESVVYCSSCGNEVSRESVSIPAAGHNYDDEWTGTEEGHWQTCIVCGEKSEVSGHAFVWLTDQEATSTDDGRRHEECSICGYVGIVEIIPATGTGSETEDHAHVYGEPEFIWSDDYTFCTAVFTCEDGDDSQEVECVVTSVDNGDGTVTYTAAAEFNETSYENIQIAEEIQEDPTTGATSGEQGEDAVTEEPADGETSSGSEGTAEEPADTGATSGEQGEDAVTEEPADGETSSGSEGTAEEPADTGDISGEQEENAGSRSSSSASSGSSVRTGDSSNIAVWLMLFVVGGTAAVLGTGKKRKQY